MLDKRTERMLDVANTLTAEDLDEIRASTGTAVMEEPPEEVTVEEHSQPCDEPPQEPPQPSAVGATRGDRERSRTRESKISTACVGQQRQKHEWWPIGMELIGHIGSRGFTAEVVQNDQVKSGRSILITSGAAQNRVCLTPTRAAIEATEDYRQANNLGRGGGVTNGWSFWEPRE